MGDNAMAMRFPAGQTMLDAALGREGVRRGLVDIRLQYFSASWALEVTCPALGYRRVQQLCPLDLRADTSFQELCDSIAEELSGRLRRANRDRARAAVNSREGSRSRAGSYRSTPWHEPS